MAEEQRQPGAEAEEQQPACGVAGFFRGRDVLVTGGSGFVGRVLLEKLLRSCPDVGCVFVLMRARKGVPPDERLKTLTDVPLFDRLRAELPSALGKLRAVAGDTTQRNLALAEDDARMLTERVSVVFHLAASVRFNDPLSVAVRNNMRGSRELLELATRMHQLKALVHVSTTFCNVGEHKYEEKIYPAPTDWKAVMAAVDAVDAGADSLPLRVLTEKILGEYCNTYTFTKKLAEHILNTYADRLPVGIVRPSVVVATASDPLPGWIDNFNGPIGLFVGAGKGLVHSAYSDTDIYMDYMPCDILVKGLLISCCEIARKGIGEPVVYQGAQSEVERITQGELINIAYEAGAIMPFKEALYHTCGTTTKRWWLFYVQFLFFHLLPAVLVDLALKLTGRKPLLVRIQRRIYSANMALSWFTMRNWNFVNKRFLELEDKLLEIDREAFSFNLHLIESKAYFFNALHGTRLYLINEPDDNLPAAKRNYTRRLILHLTLKTLFYMTITWIVLSRLYVLLFED